MKYILLLIAAFLFTACNTAHKHEGHDHSAMAGQEEDCGCGDKHDGKMGEKMDHKMDGKMGDRKCCSDKTCSTSEEATCKMTTAATPMKDNLLTKMSAEDLSQTYMSNKDQLGKTCSTAAKAYCGKTSKDKTLQEGEFNCLWTKVFRVTRESLPKLDNTDCAKMIKTFAKK